MWNLTPRHVDTKITKVGAEYFYAGEQIPRGDNANVVPIVPHIQPLRDATATVFNVAKNISLTSGEFAITSPLTITGPAAALSLDASGKAGSRVFNVDVTGSSNNDIFLPGVTVEENLKCRKQCHKRSHALTTAHFIYRPR